MNSSEEDFRSAYDWLDRSIILHKTWQNHSGMWKEGWLESGGKSDNVGGQPWEFVQWTLFMGKDDAK